MLKVFWNALLHQFLSAQTIYQKTEKVKNSVGFFLSNNLFLTTTCNTEMIEVNSFCKYGCNSNKMCSSWWERSQYVFCRNNFAWIKERKEVSCWKNRWAKKKIFRFISAVGKTRTPAYSLIPSFVLKIKCLFFLKISLVGLQQHAQRLVSFSHFNEHVEHVNTTFSLRSSARRT